MKKNKAVQGTQSTKPLEVDLDSSSTTVYIRENIVRIIDKEKGEYWQYDEISMENAEYIKFLQKDVEKQARINSNNTLALLELLETRPVT